MEVNVEAASSDEILCAGSHAAAERQTASNSSSETGGHPTAARTTRIVHRSTHPQRTGRLPALAAGSDGGTPSSAGDNSAKGDEVVAAAVFEGSQPKGKSVSHSITSGVSGADPHAALPSEATERSASSRLRFSSQGLYPSTNSDRREARRGSPLPAVRVISMRRAAFSLHSIHTHTQEEKVITLIFR